MTHLIIILVLAGIFFINAIPEYTKDSGAQTGEQKESEQGKNDFKITILYDNYPFEKDTQPDWGFSCFIEDGDKKILFDTGTDPNILFKNAVAMNVDLTETDIVVISHNHHDHNGGLLAVLQKTENIRVYLPFATPEAYLKEAENTGAKIMVERKSSPISQHCFLTGSLGNNLKEQALVLDTAKGLVVITGCSHPGIVNIVESVKALNQKEIFMVFGGFHLLRDSGETISGIIRQLKNLGVKHCGPTHCSGKKAIALFKASFKENFIKMGTGRVIEIIQENSI